MTTKLNSKKNERSQLIFHLLQRSKELMEEKYDLHKVSIRTIKADGSRLSTPVKIEGTNDSGKNVTYFGKIIGYGDLLTFRSIQTLKNIYLQLYNHEPLFEIFQTPEENAKFQFKTLQLIHKIGIPTAKPYGCHKIHENHWLLVEEYLQAAPLSSISNITIEQIDTIFKYLRKLHKKKIFHGDFKPDNILIADKIYILDLGCLRKDVSPIEKRGYDLASMIGSFLEYKPVEDIVRIARAHYSRKDLQAAANYIGLVQMRPDIHFNDEMKRNLLLRLKQKR